MLPDTHEDLRAQVRAFAESEITPRIPRMENSGDIETGLVAAMAARGWIGVTIPAAYGGMGAGHEAKTVVVDELSLHSAAMGAAVQASVLGVAKLLHFGTGEQKREWLPPIADGTLLPTIAVTEADSGGHVLGMTSTARRKGKNWVLDGRKVFVGNSAIGHLHGVVVRTGEGPGGLTAFLVEHDRKGVSAPPHPPRIGLKGFSFGELHLDAVHVSDSHRIGDIGDGLAVAYSSSVLYGRLNLAAVALGILRATLAQTTAFISGRDRITGLGVVRDRLGDITAHVKMAELAVYHAARRLDRGEPCDQDLITAKLHAVEAAQHATRLGMRTHGATGLLTSVPMERFHRDALCLEPPAGTSDIQRHRLAEEALTPGRHRPWSQRFA
uniref:acyl-CoA dehydrogenase family protein n=1 Tax=Streptomyces clavuligerus TaxID=1901 RepID=UPI0018D08532